MTPRRATSKQKSSTPKPDPISRFVVDTILPANRLHLIGGPAHSGKSTLMFRIIADWTANLKVFGYESHPAPFCFVTCNSNVDDCLQIAGRTGLDTSKLNVISTIDHDGIKNYADVVYQARQLEPKVKVIFLDGIFGISESSGLDNKVVREFLTTLLRQLRETDTTLIATGRCAKPKENRSTMRSIDRFLGATVWTELAHTYIAIEQRSLNKPKDDRRVVSVMPKNTAPFNLSYRFTDTGNLVEVSEDPAADSANRVQSLSDMISGYSDGEELTTADLLELCSTLGVVARSTMMKYIAVLVHRGELEDAGYGRYRRPTIQ